MTDTATDDAGTLGARLPGSWRARTRPWLLVSLALTTVIALFDVAVGGNATLIGFLIVGPLAASSALAPRDTALVGAYAVALALLLGIADGIFLEQDHLLRALVVVAGAALAVWGAVARSVHERTAALMTTQGAVAGILVQTPSLAEATPRLLQAIGSTLGWEAGSIWTVDRSAGVVRCLETWHAPGVDVTEFEALSKSLELEPGVGLPGQVWETCEAAWMPDLRRERNFPRAPAALAAGLRGAFAFPITGEQGCLGVIEFFVTEPRSPDDELTAFMSGLGTQIGQYIERMKGQQAVHESDALKTSILESALDCVITMDAEGRIVEFNPAAEATFGYARAEVVGRGMAELIIPPAFREQHHAGLAKYLETGEGPILNQRLELTAMGSDGSEFPVELTITPIHTDGPPLFTGYVRDITERRRAEEERERLTEELMQAGIELGRSRNQLEAILEGIADGVTAQEPGGKLVYANEAAVRTLGYASAEELFAAPVTDILDKYDILDERGRPFPMERMPGRRALQGEHPPEALVRFRIRATGEERWSIVKATPILDEGGRPLLAINIFEDITEYKRSEQTQRFLAESSRVLVGSLDYETTLEEVAQLAVPDVADWCAVEIGEPGAVTHRIAVAHVDPAKVQLADDLRRRYPPDPTEDEGVARVIRTGESEIYSVIPDELLVEAARDAEHLDLIREVGLCSVMIVPMTAFGRTMGAITFASAESGRRFTDADLELAEEIARRAAVAVENARLFRERSYIARTLQESLLPPHLPDLPGVELAARYHAAGEAYDVGGDFYDIFQTGAESWAAVIGDVRGKGPGAASVTALTRWTVRAAAMREHVPSLILEQLNEAMVQHGTEDRFCTVAYAAMEPTQSGVRVTVSCGGHPMPLILRSDGSVHSVGTPGTLLGLVPDPDLADDVAELEAGDAIVLYTDGVSEARSDEGLFGEERLVELLQSCAGLDASRIVERIQRDVLEYQDEQPRDDVAVLVLKVRDKGALRQHQTGETRWPADAQSTAPV